MKYSIVYKNDLSKETLEQADEIIIKYEKFNDKIIDFIQTFKDTQRIVLDVSCIYSDDKFVYNNLGVFKRVIEIHKNFALMVSPEQLFDYASELYDLNIKYFLNYLITNYEDLKMCIDYKCSDVIIGNFLGFELDTVRKTIGDRINIIVIPNICQTNNVKVNELLGFWIRPEDIKFYSRYVDICIINADTANRQDTLFKIYKKGEWLGDLKDLISGLNVNIPNTGIAPFFGNHRINCGKRCLKGSPCDICGKAADFAKILDKKNIEVRYEQEK